MATRDFIGHPRFLVRSCFCPEGLGAGTRMLKHVTTGSAGTDPSDSTPSRLPHSRHTGGTALTSLPSAGGRRTGAAPSQGDGVPGRVDPVRARGGIRTHTSLSGPALLRRIRLPV